MAWLSGHGGRLPRHKLHAARFRRLIQAVRGLVELHDDATEKLAGQWVIDRGYVASFGQRALDLGRQLVFDSGVLADEPLQETTATLDEVRSGLAAVLARPEDDVQPGPRVVPLKQAAEARTVPICNRVRLLAEAACQLGTPVAEGFVVTGLEAGLSEATRHAIAEATAELCGSGEGGTFSLYPACSESGATACPEEWSQAMTGILPQRVADACEALVARLDPRFQTPGAPRCISCLLEPPARARGLLYTSDPGSPLNLRLDVLAGSGRRSYVSDRFSQPEPEQPGGGAVPPEYEPFLRVALAVERFAGRPQVLAWILGDDDAGFTVLQCSDIALPPSIAPSGPRLAEALSRCERVIRDPSSVAVAGFAAGHVYPATHPPPPDEKTLAVLVLPQEQSELPDLSLRRAAAVLAAKDRSLLPWLAAARQARIPVLAGLGEAVRRLSAGEPVTIDAQEGAVYRGIARELVLYHLVEPTGYQTEPEYRLLRSAIDWVAPPTTPSETWAATPPGEAPRLKDVLRLAHERALESFEGLRYGWWGRSGVPVEGSGFPGSLRVVDAGGGTSPAHRRGWRAGLTFEQVRSEPLRALLEPLAGARGARLRRGHAAPATLAVVTEESVSVDVEWPRGVLLLDACLGDHAPTNSVYCAFRSPGRAGHPEPLRDALEECGFRLLDLGTGLTGWVVGGAHDETARTLRRLGRALEETLGSSGRKEEVEPGGH